MKIAFLAAQSSVHTVRWVNALADRGYEIHLFTVHPEREPVHPAVRVHEIHGLFPKPALSYFFSAPALRKKISEVKPDILHAHYATGYGTLGRLSRFRPFLLSVWGSDVYEYPFYSPLHRYIVTKNLRAADLILSTSRAMAQQTLKLEPNVRGIEITPFGVDVAQFRPQPEYKDPRFFTVGTVKSLAPQYGIDLLLHAFALAQRYLVETAPDVGRSLRLLIVGDGPERKRLEALSRHLGIDKRTTFVGAVPHREVTRYLNQLDVYIALSRYESFGVAVLEAQACGIPVIVSDVGGLPEVVSHESTGFVVPKENPQSAAEKIVLFALNREILNKMKNSAREFVIQKFSWESSVKKMESVYESFYKNKNR
ncbi:glycosyltransferase [Brockia lithotrophica]|uniref:Glycosyltransferase involved in cell wall biosynthesis n=1 Tax=Brockia lithotrophica TaxID=933949 RepID=A0A660KVW6_9BACL|nr:glycosyltransferase [Brockia lithotrophica]RKQ85532.1 glycosyltransferase involved in cell wall biosynthesis [Brockia lithotrophica]